MRNKILITLVFIVLVASAVLAICLSIEKPRKIHIFTYEQDFFRKGLLPSLKNAWMAQIPAANEDFIVIDFTDDKTTDNIPWDSIKTSDVIISLLKPGKKPLPSDQIIVCGPIHQFDESFMQQNISNASFMTSDVHLPFLQSDLEEQFGIMPQNTYFASVDGRIPYTSTNRDAPLKILELSKLAEHEVFPPRSALVVSIDGKNKDYLNELSNIALEKNLAIVVDRMGYLHGNVFAEYGASLDSLGEGLGRLAAKRFQEKNCTGEIRGVAVFTGHYSPRVAAALKLGTPPGTFTPTISDF